MDNFNVTVITVGIVMGGILFALLLGNSIQVGAQRYTERFNACVTAGGMWIPMRGDNEAACVRQ